MADAKTPTYWRKLPDAAAENQAQNFEVLRDYLMSIGRMQELALIEGEWERRVWATLPSPEADAWLRGLLQVAQTTPQHLRSFVSFPWRGEA